MTRKSERQLVLKAFFEEKSRLEEEFWAINGGRPKGKGDVPRYIFADAVAKMQQQLKEIDSKFFNMEDKFCPLCKRDIADEICFDISMVMEQMAPNWTAPDDVEYSVENEHICLNCPRHPE